MAEQRLHAPEALGEREQSRARGEAARFLRIRFQLERDDAAEIFHLAAGKVVARMSPQAGIKDVRDRGMLAEKLRQQQRVRAMPLHAERERLHPAKREEAILRTGDGADRVLKEA